MKLQKRIVKKSIKHKNRAIKSRETKLDKKNQIEKYPEMKLKKIQTSKSIKSQINNN